MKRRVLRSFLALVAVLGLVLGSVPGAVVAQGATPEATPADGATPVASPVAASQPLDSTASSVDLDVLVIGAHPDDEAFGLAAYGQWNEYADVNVGVITVTRGEGGGNAVGTEEGPALGVLREAEERAAVSTAGIEHIYNLDKVDFYYTVSAPLTEATWGYEETLAQVVRVVRATTPEVIITMNPAPTPGNHGHHQVAARLAVDAFYRAADPEAFAEQVNEEGFPAWSVSSIFQAGAAGEGQPGPACATSFAPVEPTDTIYGVWQGTVSEANGGRTWGEIARDGQRMYASQGWAVFPDAPTDPAEIQCNYFTLIDSRVALSTNPMSTTAMLENAVVPAPQGLPLGTQFYLTSDAFNVLPGQEFTVTAHVRVPEGTDVSASSIDVVAPSGWEIVGAAELATEQADPEAEPAFKVADDGSISQEFTIVPGEDAIPGTRYRIGASFGIGGNIGVTNEVVQVSPAVSGVLEPLPEIAQFLDWADAVGVPQLYNLIFPVTSIGIGETRDVSVVVTNNSTETASGKVSIELPAGFTTDSATMPYDGLAAGASTTVSFSVTNDDTSLATANEGGEDGTYAFTISTSVGDNEGASSQQAGLNLVPSTVVPEAAADAAVDGVIADGEYTGSPLDLSRVWEGDPPDSAADASGSAWVSWDDDGLYVAVQVDDDTLGTVLTPDDAKRHWRTDSVEIAIDPLGTAPNTSATFKVGVFPTGTDNAPHAYRDADAYQGPVAETAPGFEVASTLTDPYNGYVIETFIPFDSLPAGIDPDNAAMNIFIYDSDTQDLTGQTRLGWSTWGGVQGDPYRWGTITLEGFEGVATPAAASPAADGATPVTGEPVVDAPVMPLDVAQSAQSPQSIAQSAADGVPLAGLSPVAAGDGLTFQRLPTLAGGNLVVSFEAASNGTARYYLVDGGGTVIANGEVDVSIGATELTESGGTAGGDVTLLVSFVTDSGQVQALSLPVSSSG